MKKNTKKGSWLKRLFNGGSKTLVEENPSLAVEEIVSPMKQIVRGFFERKLAVTALCVLICMFLIVFIGPLLMPKYYNEYEEIMQQNQAPNMKMMNVPKELADDIKKIDGFGNFTVGLSNSGKVYVWGDTYNPVNKIELADIPEDVQNAKIVDVAGGYDHIIAIDEEGKVYGWGAYTLGQYLYLDDETAEKENIVSIPRGLYYHTQKIDVNNIKKLTCGYQMTALLMNDGTLYLWGNKKAYQNTIEFFSLNYSTRCEDPDHDTLVDIDFTLNNIVGLDAKGRKVITGSRDLYSKFKDNLTGTAVPGGEFLGTGRKFVSLAATSNNICCLLNDGTLAFTGYFDRRSATELAPALHDGEAFTQIVSGAQHYVGLTSEGRVLAWGGNLQNQLEVPDKLTGVTKLYGCSFQTYAVNDSGKLVGKWGSKGHLFGTDRNGADILQRIVQGGKMTMTIGAIAVIISTVIGIIIGCVSGYFGGKVDMILMRVTEIFAAIPFLPFALILSAIMAQMNISENQKIFMLMVILGLLTWTGLARMVRGQVLVARENEYVTAAKAMGVRESTIAFKHILPNIVSIIFVSLTLDFATCLLTESSLSYLGFGVTFPRPTWGNMLNGANNATIIKNYWWQWVFPSIFLAITCICINVIGDALRDVMDPKSDRDK